MNQNHFQERSGKAARVAPPAARPYNSKTRAEIFMTASSPQILVLDSAGEPRHVTALFKALGVHPGGFEYMAPKFRFYLLKAAGVENRAANVLKQELLSLGHDAAVAEDVSLFREGSGDVVFGASEAALRRLAEKLREQPFGLKRFASAMEAAVEGWNRRHAALRLPDGRTLSLQKPLVMGILNVTPDSFSDGGLWTRPEDALRRAMDMLEEGADILDVGGESSRPGAKPVAAEEQIRRAVPVIAAVRKRSGAPISIDTTSAAVTEAALDAGADIVNDISAGAWDEAMLPLAARRRAAVALMHMQGRPETMQARPLYGDVLFETAAFLRGRAEAALGAGISAGSILLDPGIGFGKTHEHNLTLLRHLGTLRSLGYPLLVGVSRKSLVEKIAGAGDPLDRLDGSLAAEVLAFARGARVLRTHAVKETRRALAVAEAVLAALPCALPAASPFEESALHVEKPA
jgi:dihydropteroate synthase